MSTARLTALAAVALLAGAGAASALTITSTASYGIAGAPQTTDWSHGFTVNGFDPTLGTLTGVSFTFASSADFSGSVLNKSPSAANFTVSEDIKLSGSSTNAGLNAIIAGLTQDLVISQSYTALASNTSANFGPYTISNSASATSLDFAAFETGPIASTFSTVTGTSVVGGGGNINSSITTKAGATLSVTYTYTPPAVPEPASLMLVLAGLTGLVAMRRRAI